MRKHASRDGLRFPPGPGTRRVALYLIVGWLALFVTWDYWVTVESVLLEEKLDAHVRLLSGEEPSPYRYRVLGSWVGELLRRGFSELTTPRRAFHVSQLSFNFACLVAFLGASFALFRRWFGWREALVGLFSLLIPLQLSFRWPHPYQPWTFLEAPLFVLGLLAVLRGRWGLCVLVIVIATLNRETALYIPLVALFVVGPDVVARRADGGREATVGVLSAFGAWAATHGALRLVLGHAEHIRPLRRTFEYNTRPFDLVNAAVHLSLFLGAYWLIGVLGLRRAPERLRRATWLFVPVFALFLVFARWHEARVLLPLAPLGVLAGLSALFDAGEDRPPGSGRGGRPLPRRDALG